MLAVNQSTIPHNSFAGSDINVTRLGFGAMGFAGAFGAVDEKEGIRALLKSLEQGINLIDTARHYGDSEMIVGKALKEWKGEKPFIATKVQSLGRNNTRWGIPPKVEDTFPKGAVTTDTEKSLKLLGVEQIDLMQMHLYWPNWGVSGYWLDELLKLKEQGKVKFIGISNPDHRHDTAIPLVNTGLIDSVQTIINIFDPIAFDSLVPICQQNNVAIIARCILDEGGLTGFLTENTTFEETDFRKTFFEQVPRAMYIEKVNALKKFIPQQASSLAALAIKFVLGHPGVTSAITSMHIEKFANQNIEAVLEPGLSEEVFTEIRYHHRWVRNFFDSKYWMQIDGLK